jgi:hypothetical protein
MAALRQQALGIINVCKTALAGKRKEQHDNVDNPTIAIAQAILAQAKAAVPDDTVLAAVSLEPPISFWTTIQTAMEMVIASLLPETDADIVKALNAGRERVAKHKAATAERAGK